MNTPPDLLKAIRTGRLAAVVAALDAGVPVELDDGKGEPGLPLVEDRDRQQHRWGKECRCLESAGRSSGFSDAENERPSVRQGCGAVQGNGCSSWRFDCSSRYAASCYGRAAQADGEEKIAGFYTNYRADTGIPYGTNAGNK